jgi:hypothetical protein
MGFRVSLHPLQVVHHIFHGGIPLAQVAVHGASGDARQPLRSRRIDFEYGMAFQLDESGSRSNFLLVGGAKYME